MAIVKTDDKYYKSIAQMIRNILGTSTKIKPSQMANKFLDVYNRGVGDGYTNGHALGFGDGFDNGYAEGLESGRSEQHARFWNSYQQNGNRRSYTAAFGYAWTDECYDPLYPVICNGTGGNNLFQYNTNITDTKGPITFGTSASYAFNWCNKLKRTHIVVNKSTTFTSTFSNCTSLEDLIVDGTIGQNGFDVSGCPLTVESVLSVLHALEDKSGDTSGTDWLVKLGSANLALVGSDCEIATSKGWRYT